MKLRESAVRVVLLYPDLLGTYGDGGNAVILAQRLRWRGQTADVATVRSADPVPDGGDLYVVGGGEDLPQALAARQLGRRGPLQRAVDGGAAVLAVCAGLQILGTSFVGPDGVETDGLGLVDARTIRGPGPRAVGELVVEPSATQHATLALVTDRLVTDRLVTDRLVTDRLVTDRLPTLSGYENHGGVTALGPGVVPLGRVRVGVGNGTGPTPDSATDLATAPATGSAPGALGDGFLVGRVVGTYLHGPVLARNPALADLLLTSVVGDLEPVDDTESEGLRRERLAAADRRAGAGASGRWRQRLGMRVGG